MSLFVNWFNKLLDEELIDIEKEIGEEKFSNGKFKLATQLFKSMITSNNFDEFLTLPAYNYI